MEAPVIYQHPLAYVLGLEGIALLRGFSGVYDQDFTLARFREIQALLGSAEELGDGVEIRPITREGYDRWAPFYDEPGNMLLEIEQPIVRETSSVARPGHGRHERGLARKAGRDHLALPALLTKALGRIGPEDRPSDPLPRSRAADRLPANLLRPIPSGRERDLLSAAHAR